MDQQNAEQAMSLNREGVSLASENQLEKALEVLKRAEAVCPGYPTTLHNLGAVYMMRGDTAEAARCYLRQLEIEPNSYKSHYNLANIYLSVGRRDDAISHLKSVITLNPQHHSAGHILATCTGEASDRAPASFVAQLFDQYAATFDKSLVQDLSYITPASLRSMLVGSLGDSAIFTNALDIGCGTGLSGVEFRPLCRRLVGVDLSSKMLEKCKAKNVYQELHHADALEFLRSSPGKFDLFIAADTFVYIGDLLPVLAEIKARAAATAHIIFSTEAHDGTSFRLTPTARFSHAKKYVEELAVKLEMTLVAWRSEPIRKEKNALVQGNLYLLRVDGGTPLLPS